MKDIVTIHQPNYLPWLGFFHKIMISDTYVAFDDVQFEKNSFNNRNKIKTANGSCWLTVPILTSGKSSETLINIAQLDNHQKWADKHLKTIQANYVRSAYYNNYIGFFEKTYSESWNSLSHLNIHIIQWLLKELDIHTKMVISSQIPSKEGKKDKLVLDICKKFNAQIYVSGELGKDYLNTSEFKKEAIEVYFQDFQHPVYTQLWGDFVPYMSVIDLMFNHGPKSKDIIMKGNINKEQLLKQIIL